MDLPHLHGIVPPLPTPLTPDESIDVPALRRLIDGHLNAGVHGLWILGTTARFDLLTDASMRVVAETAAESIAGRVPTVLNVSDMGTKRTLERARIFDDLPYDYYAVLAPWYQAMSPLEVLDFYRELADSLSKPLVIYNAPWIVNQLDFANLRKLAEHPRIKGTKDVNTSLARPLDWSVAERRQLDFSYLQAHDLIASGAEATLDGFVTAIADPFPELAVAAWEAARAGKADVAYRLQSQLVRLSRATGFGGMHACVEVMCRRRGWLDRMLPAPLRAVDAATAARIEAVLDEVGVLPAV
ncbi:MAG: dihydrodipicolinate synthase family protein [Isosphaeraceae bacterium]|nr:dihydrodipicolinate synthase family protein [Isosphaeraceae bacterium]